MVSAGAAVRRRFKTKMRAGMKRTGAAVMRLIAPVPKLQEGNKRDKTKTKWRGRRWNRLRALQKMWQCGKVHSQTVTQSNSLFDWRKKQKDLLAFKLSIAQALCMQGKDLSAKKRGRPSSDVARELKKKQRRGPTKAIPTQDVRADAVGHWPQIDSVRQRCKFPKCTGHTSIKCTKCDVHLCLNKNCFCAFHEWEKDIHTHSRTHELCYACMSYVVMLHCLFTLLCVCGEVNPGATQEVFHGPCSLNN